MNRKPLKELEKIIKNGTCLIITVKQLMKYSKKYQYKKGIPKIIHYMNNDENVPIQYSTYVNGCMTMNNYSRFVFWTYPSLIAMINSNFPNHSAMFNSYLNNNQAGETLKISDISRYFILMKFGGIYIDMDTQCQKPFHTVMDNYSCIISKENEIQSRLLFNYEYLVMNNMMACVRNHSFFRYVLDKLIRADKSNILHQTGPIMLTERYKDYVKRFNNSKENLIISNSTLFSPVVLAYVRERCKVLSTLKLHVEACKDLLIYKKKESVLMKEAISLHWYLNLGYDFNKHLIKIRQYICKFYNNLYLIIL